MTWHNRKNWLYRAVGPHNRIFFTKSRKTFNMCCYSSSLGAACSQVTALRGRATLKTTWRQTQGRQPSQSSTHACKHVSWWRANPLRSFPPFGERVQLLFKYASTSARPSHRQILSNERASRHVHAILAVDTSMQAAIKLVLSFVYLVSHKVRVLERDPQ